MFAAELLAVGISATDEPKQLSLKNLGAPTSGAPNLFKMAAP